MDKSIKFKMFLNYGRGLCILFIAGVCVFFVILFIEFMVSFGGEGVGRQKTTEMKIFFITEALEEYKSEYGVYFRNFAVDGKKLIVINQTNLGEREPYFNPNPALDTSRLNNY